MCPKLNIMSKLISTPNMNKLYNFIFHKIIFNKINFKLNSLSICIIACSLRNTINFWQFEWLVSVADHKRTKRPTTTKYVSAEGHAATFDFKLLKL